MEEIKPRFTGIFISAEILDCEELSPIDQILISLIDVLYSKDHGGCSASNSDLAKFINIKPNTISKHLTHLRKLGLLKYIYVNETTRILKVNKKGEVIHE